MDTVKNEERLGILDALQEMRERKEEEKEERQEILESLVEDPEIIREVDNKWLKNKKFIKDALSANGNCIHFMSKEIKTNPDMLLIASGTNPEFVTYISPEDLYTKGRYRKAVSIMKKSAHALKARLLEENPDISYFELKDAIGDYLKTYRTILREKQNEFAKIRRRKKAEEQALKAEKRIKAEQQRAEKQRKRLQRAIERSDKHEDTLRKREGSKIARLEKLKTKLDGEISEDKEKFENNRNSYESGENLDSDELSI